MTAVPYAWSGRDSQGNVRSGSGTVEVQSSTPLKVIGMSAPASLWSTRLAEVGANGIRARRIFCDLANGADHQRSVTEQALNANMMPVLSYKVGGNITGALNGQYDNVANQTAARLRGYGKQIAVTFWHEPNPDITGQQFCDLHRRYLPIFQSANVKVGPILNGWLLDNQVSTFNQYAAPDLIAAWDFVAVDIYASGSGPSSPGQSAARGIINLAAWMEARGYTDPIGIGEYNGWNASQITSAGNAILDEDSLWFALVFNSDVGDKGNILDGAEIDAFKATKADPRVLQ